MPKSKTNGLDLDQSEALNILNRPKRSINYENFDYSKISPDLLKQLKEESETEDEEFIPKDEVDEENDDDDDEDEDKDDSSESDESENSSENQNDGDESETNKKNAEHAIKKEPREANENGFANSHKKDSKSKLKDEAVSSKPKKSKKNELNDKDKLDKKKTQKTQSKKKLKQQKTKLKQFELDEDTQKIINSFRTAKIVKKSKSLKDIKQEPTIKQDATAKNNTIATIATIAKASSSLQNVNLIPPRDKYEPITDFDSDWVCSLCSQPGNYKLGVGDLFGPYRIRHEHENDKNFKEIWLHEGCAIWSPNIYLSENHLRGITGVLNLAMISKCGSCKNFGATLKCSSCVKKFHYPCAIKEECIFNDETFTILCKKHSD